MKFTIEFNSTELKASINNGVLLALAETANETDVDALAAAKLIQTEKVQPSDNTQYIPVPQPEQIQQSIQPQEQYVAPTTTVPTTAPTYNMDQLSVAATQLVDAGRRTELVALLSSFGVQALTALPKEQYGAFATSLRAMGAKI